MSLRTFFFAESSAWGQSDAPQRCAYMTPLAMSRTPASYSARSRSA